jgi:hypothetical protein
MSGIKEAVVQTASDTDSTVTDSDCKELVRFLKEKGLGSIAAKFSEAMGVDLVENLVGLTMEDLNDPTFGLSLTGMQKKSLLRLAQDITARSASLRSSDLNDSDVSGAETASEASKTASERGTASEGGDTASERTTAR